MLFIRKPRRGRTDTLESRFLDSRFLMELLTCFCQLRLNLNV